MVGSYFNILFDCLLIFLFVLIATCFIIFHFLEVILAQDFVNLPRLNHHHDFSYILIQGSEYQEIPQNINKRGF